MNFFDGLIEAQMLGHRVERVPYGMRRKNKK